MFQQYSQLSVQHHCVLKNKIIPQDVCGWECSPRGGVLMTSVGRSDHNRIWCAHQKSQSRCHSNNAAAAWAEGSQCWNFWHQLWLSWLPLCWQRKAAEIWGILNVSLIHGADGGGPEKIRDAQTIILHHWVNDKKRSDFDFERIEEI